MNRLYWTDGLLAVDETLIHSQNCVRLYDGDNKTSYESGQLLLTTHRLLWRDANDAQCVLALDLCDVVFTEEQASGLAKSAKIVTHLGPVTGPRKAGPATSSAFSYLRFGFKEGGQVEFYRNLTDAISRKRWVLAPASARGLPSKRAVGIAGIEKSIHKKAQETGKDISTAFTDMSELITKAKDMVELSKNISQKLKETQGEITEDEAVQFKSYLLSLGIPDPVTRETHGSGQTYFTELAKQLAAALETPLKESGGIMTLSDVYCRINRARGMELLSPDDLLLACKQLDNLSLPIRMKIFDSGVKAIQLRSHSEEQTVTATREAVQTQDSLTAEALAQLLGLSVVLAQERLLTAERAGALCRDESTEGLRFYDNKFLSES